MTPARSHPTSHQPPLMTLNKSDDAPTALETKFPIYQVLHAFEGFSHSEPACKAQHRSLFYFLVGYVRKLGLVTRFELPRDTGMHGAAIGSKSTYVDALRDLQAWGFLHYTEGANRFVTPIVEMFPVDYRGPQMALYWAAYCASIESSTEPSRRTNNRQEDNKTINTLEREADASARAAEKKIQELQKKIDELTQQLQAAAQPAPAPPVAPPPAPPAESDEPPLVPEPLPEGAVLPAFVDPRLADDDPRKWESVPRDVQMVQEYIDSYSQDPAVQARGKGKAHLFFEHYGSVGWKVLGKNGPAPIANWRYLIRQFQFREQHVDQSKPPHQDRPSHRGSAAQAARVAAAQPAEGIRLGQPLTGSIDDL